jgi:sugar phosphate isomerase/epimerase
MRIGTRVTTPQEVTRWDTEIIQISVYHGQGDNIDQIKKCVDTCREVQKRYVIHPVLYSIFNKEMFRDLIVMASLADLALILHDEKRHNWERLTGEHETTFKKLLKELQSLATVSFENATDTRDAIWFWDNYADSITLDIGHVELAGIDAVQFVKALDMEVIDKIQYVHLHRNNGWRNGLTDHWYITPDCKEVMALKELLRRKQDIGIILEINETEKTEESLKILQEIKSELAI